MSSILLRNPFAPPAVPPAAPQAAAAHIHAVAPTQSASGQADTDTPTAFSGRRGTGGQRANAALMQAHVGARPDQISDATRGSVVDAQTRDAPKIVPFGADMPPVEMPDPLPTSPFLKRV